MEIKINNLFFMNLKEQKYILENINIDILISKVNGIIGKSGSGKSILLELISGIKTPSSGSIEIGNYLLDFNSKPDYNIEIKQNIGFLSSCCKNEKINKTVKDVIQEDCKKYNYRINEIEKRTIDSLMMVGLDDSYLGLRLQELSKSEYKKISLASILIYNPKIVILDEPTLGFDSKNKKEFINLIRILKNRYKKTIIIATNDLDFLHKCVDKVIVLQDGKIVMQGNKYEIFCNTKELKKYGIIAPKIIKFSDKVKNKKNIKIGYRDDINDLIKDIFRNV